MVYKLYFSKAILKSHSSMKIILALLYEIILKIQEIEKNPFLSEEIILARSNLRSTKFH